MATLVTLAVGTIVYPMIISPIISSISNIKETIQKFHLTDTTGISKKLKEIGIENELSIIYTFLCELPHLTDSKGEIIKFGDSPEKYQKAVIDDRTSKNLPINEKMLTYVKYPRSCHQTIEYLIELINEIKTNVHIIEDKLIDHEAKWFKSLRNIDCSGEILIIEKSQINMRRQVDFLISLMK